MKTGDKKREELQNKFSAKLKELGVGASGKHRLPVCLVELAMETLFGEVAFRAVAASNHDDEG